MWGWPSRSCTRSTSDARGAAARAAARATCEKLLDLVAIGTIADLAALRGENRYYVQGRAQARRHRAAGRACGRWPRCRAAPGSVDSGTVAYRLAPRLNAAGRLADPSPPLRLLLTEDEEEAAALAQQLHELNGARQDVERQILEEAVAACRELAARCRRSSCWPGRSGTRGWSASWPSRLVERYHRPTILLGVRDGVAKGSGRSIAGYDSWQGSTPAPSHLTVYGGHPQAVGSHPGGRPGR